MLGQSKSDPENQPIKARRQDNQIHIQKTNQCKTKYNKNATPNRQVPVLSLSYQVVLSVV